VYNQNHNYQKGSDNSNFKATQYSGSNNYNKKDNNQSSKKDFSYYKTDFNNNNQTWDHKNNKNYDHQNNNSNNNNYNTTQNYNNYEKTNNNYNDNYDNNYDNKNKNHHNKKGNNFKQNFNEKKAEKVEKIEVIQRIVDPKSGKHTVQVTHKEFSEKSKPVFNQDLEDDYFDEETYGESNFNEDADEQYDDELYDYGDRSAANFNDDYDDPFAEDIGGLAAKGNKGFQPTAKGLSTKEWKFQGVASLTDKFANKLSLTNNPASYGNSSYNKIDNSYNKNDYAKKSEMMFDNTECFTDYVDRMLSGENKKYSQDITDSYVNVLMIAEKPSIARSIADALGSGKYNTKSVGRGKTIISFEGFFGSARAKFTVSSVMGHVYTSDFQKEHNQWSAIDALDLYEAPIMKIDANPKTHIPSFISSLATGKDILCLWLDCDKEGENICFEVINNTYKYMNKKSYQQIYRAKFSSLTKVDLKAAFNNMRERPNKFESLSVDVRQVIDLKIGVSFTRFLTSSILPGLKGEDEIKLISYGPCQTPTLWFCVNRMKEISSFIPKEYFRIYTDVEVKKIKKRIFYEKNFYEKKATDEFLRKFDNTKKANVMSVEVKVNTKTPPAGMNTVAMLRIASSYLKISPHNTMVIAEKLYTMGYVTYPRTETTKYAASFDFKKALTDFASHAVFGPKINTHILKNYQRYRKISVFYLLYIISSFYIIVLAQLIPFFFFKL